MSAKRSAQEAIYRRLKTQFLKENPVCQVCDKAKSVDVHHRRRRGKFLNDTETWTASCRNCHRGVEENPEWSRERGLIVYDWEDWTEKQEAYKSWQESKLKHA